MTSRIRLRRAAARVRLGREDNPALARHLGENPHDDARWGILADSLEEEGLHGWADVFRKVGLEPHERESVRRYWRQWVDPTVAEGNGGRCGFGVVRGRLHGLGVLVRQLDKGTTDAPDAHDLYIEAPRHPDATWSETMGRAVVTPEVGRQLVHELAAHDHETNVYGPDGQTDEVRFGAEGSPARTLMTLKGQAQLARAGTPVRLSADVRDLHRAVAEKPLDRARWFVLADALSEAGKPWAAHAVRKVATGEQVGTGHLAQWDGEKGSRMTPSTHEAWGTVAGLDMQLIHRNDGRWAAWIARPNSTIGLGYLRMGAHHGQGLLHELDEVRAGDAAGLKQMYPIPPDAAQHGVHAGREGSPVRLDGPGIMGEWADAVWLMRRDPGMAEAVRLALRGRAGPVRFTPTGPELPGVPGPPGPPGPPEPEEEPEPEDETWTCPNCDHEHADEDESRVRSDGVHACTECSTTCPECDEVVDPDDMREAHTSGRRGYGRRSNVTMVCPECVSGGSFFECADCGDTFHENLSGGSNTNDDSVCQGCGENYFHCDGCNSTCHNDDYGEGGNCRECSESEGSDLINGYNHHPTPRFHGEGRHYGVELETVVKTGDLHDAAERTLDLLGDDFAYLKSDSSLDGGVGQFEIVTHPATLPVHRERWEKFLAHRPKGLVSHDAGCCGLHVHVEKAGLSDLEIFKMVAFVNAASNREFVEAVARRASERYAKLDPNKRAKDVVSPPKDRYEAVNLQNDDTVEFRIFKGTLNRDSFFRSLEFVDAVTEFAKAPDVPIRAVHGTGAFFRFVMGRQGEYPLLAKFVDNFARSQDAKELEQSMASAQLRRAR